MKYFLVLAAFISTFTADGAPVAIKSIDDVVANLKSDNPTGKKRAIDWLNNKKNPVVETEDHPNPLLLPLLTSEKKNLRNAATKAYLRWARPEARLPAFQTLFRTNPARGREYFEEQVEKRTKHFPLHE